MSRDVRFRRAARAEFLDAAEWYESRRAGLGAEYVAEIERCISLGAEAPRMFPVVHRDVRCVRARRFPYSVYFRVEPGCVVVLAIFHGRRNPAGWRARN